ncbi:60S ribosomal protein L44 [Heracleum sosnowskyi]|uniref:60S ribosomal protein L44 n=1 Tax=Heracleum sosnowskyi TaxID=360622 RepID=A0AAD8GQ71_9APIA|nr:60S ribosomal protein L44 [Heracleum sosnowskyi]
MGAACCVAAKDRAVTSRSGSEVIQRNVRYSPSWSFRWDNRRRVAGEEMSLNSLSDGINRNDGFDIKSRTTVGSAYVSEEGSPLDSFRSYTWQKSPIREGDTGLLCVPPSDPLNSRDSTEVKEFTAISDPSPTKTSPSTRSISSLQTSPLSYQNHFHPASSTPSRRPRRSPGHQLLRQVSDNRIQGFRSPSFSISEEGSTFGLPAWSNETIGGSQGGSSDNWFIPGFPELMAASRSDRWSFNSESLGITRSKLTRSSGRSFSSSSGDVTTCGVCSRLITEKSSWARQSIIGINEVAVVAVLVCGHVYHVECLENMTPSEISKYDPPCPVCTLGEKETLKLSEKALRSEISLVHLKTKISKIIKKKVADSDLSGDPTLFNRQKSCGLSSSKTSASSTHFLKRHFSFGLKGTKTFSEGHTSRKKGFFWAKSSKQRASP